SYDDSTLKGILTGSGTNALGVQGVPVTIDPTGVSALTSTFAVDGVSYPTTGAQTVHLLPRSFAVVYSMNGTTTTLNFAVSSQDQVTFNPSDPSQAELAGLRENEVFLLAPVVQTFPVRINSDILFQLAQTRQPTYTLNGQTELAGVQTFNLAAEEYVIV